MNVVLERIGDYAVTICREAVQLPSGRPSPSCRTSRISSSTAHRALEQALQAFADGDAELARETAELTRRRTRRFHHVFTDLLRVARSARGRSRTSSACSPSSTASSASSDQAKNICEETIFAVTGETKQPKVYSILFVDEKATAGARWRPRSPGRRSRRAAATPVPAGIPRPPSTRGSLRSSTPRGYAIPEGPPARMPTDARRASRLPRDREPPGEVRGRLPDPPFHTVILRWDAVHDRDRTDDEALEADRKRIAHELRELMETAARRGSGLRWRRHARPPLPRRRHELDRRGSSWYVDKVVQVLVFVGGISAIVFIVGIFVFITPRGVGLHRRHHGRRRVLHVSTLGARPPSSNPTYGALALIVGTASVTGLAMLVAVPFSLGAADLHRRVRQREDARDPEGPGRAAGRHPVGGLGLHRAQHHEPADHRPLRRAGRPQRPERRDHPGPDGGADHDDHRRGRAQGRARPLPRSRRGAGRHALAGDLRRVVLPAARTAWWPRCCSASGAASARPWPC